MIRVFILGSKCNMHCKFCMSAERDLDPNIIADHLSKMSAGDLAVFAGGEPLIYPYLKHLLAIAKLREIKTKIHTNGILIDRIDFLDLIDVINLPLDGPRDIHDSMRMRGHFDVVMNVLEKIEKPFTITTVLTRKNIDCLAELAGIIDEISEKREILNWKIFRFKPKGRGTRYREEFEISRKEFLNAKEAVRSRVKTYFIDDPDRMNAEVICRV